MMSVQIPIPIVNRDDLLPSDLQIQGFCNLNSERQAFGVCDHNAAADFCTK